MLILLAIGLVMAHQRGEGAPHTMSPTAVAVTLLLALLIDFASLGPNSYRDKIAFCLATPAIREGFDGSPLDKWTIGHVHDWIQKGLDEGPVKGSYMSMADVNVVIGAIVGLIWVYAVLCLLPSRPFTKRLGRAAALQFPTSPQRRLNPTMWAVAAILGLAADLPGGALGITCRGAIDALITPITWIMTSAFGA